MTFLPATLMTLAIATAGLFLCRILLRRGDRANLPLPPSPRPLPLLGNVLDFPKVHLGREFHALSQVYGHIVHLQVFGQSVILVGSYETACELLERRSANYSDRPQSVMVDLTNLDWIFVFKNYTPQWRQYRRTLHNSFVPDLMVRYYPMQLRITRDLLCNLLDTPAEFSSHLKFSFAAVILRIVYGLEVTQGDDKYYKLVERLATIAEDISTPGRHIVEAFPWLKRAPSWFPGTGFRTLAATWKAELATIRNYLYDSARSEMSSRGVKESVLTRLTEEAAEEEMSRNVTATIYASGADTTNAAVHAFVLAMAMFPESQRKAQAELDSAVGLDRLPDFSDQQSLPYVAALIKEVLRWHVVAPIGVPHRSVADDIYNGYLIPAGSIVIPNQWAMSRDPEHYPDPERFNPDRFLLEGQLNPNIRDPESFVFGFGRRRCPGRHFADVSLFITCASILHTLEISAPLDERGVPRKMELKISSLAVSHPKPFECRIRARSAHMDDLVRASVA